MYTGENFVFYGIRWNLVFIYIYGIYYLFIAAREEEKKGWDDREKGRKMAFSIGLSMWQRKRCKWLFDVGRPNSEIFFSNCDGI